MYTTPDDFGFVGSPAAPDGPDWRPRPTDLLEQALCNVFTAAGVLLTETEWDTVCVVARKYLGPKMGQSVEKTPHKQEKHRTLP